jgi:hypothetical protein
MSLQGSGAGARRAVHTRYAGSEAKLAAQRDGRALLREQRIGSAVNHPFIESIGTNDTTEPLAGLDEQRFDTTPLQLVGRSESGNASADDGSVERIHAVHSSDFSVLCSCSLSVFGSAFSVLCSVLGSSFRACIVRTGHRTPNGGI